MSLKAAYEGEHRSRQILAAIFVDLMESTPAEQLPCPVVVSTALQILVRKQTIQEDAADVAHIHPDVIRSCVRFLMLPRDVDQRVALWEAGKQGRCACSHSAALMHELHRPDLLRFPFFVSSIDYSLPRLLAVLFRVVVNALTAVATRGVKRSLKDARRASRNGTDVWPAHPDDLAPGGLAIALPNLCAWAEYVMSVELLIISEGLCSMLGKNCMPMLFLKSIVLDVFVYFVGDALVESAGPEDVQELVRELAIAISYMDKVSYTISHRQIVYLARTVPSKQWDDLVQVCSRAYEALRSAMRSPTLEISAERCMALAERFMDFGARIHAVLDLRWNGQMIAILERSRQISRVLDRGPFTALAVYLEHLYS